MLLTYVLIGLGGALGSMARAWMTLAVARVAGTALPWGTIAINIFGSFVIGFFGSLTAGGDRFVGTEQARAFVMIGICGGFTTFSSFSLQTMEMLRHGRTGSALVNIALSVVLCLVAVAAGLQGGAGLVAMRR